MGEYRGCGGRRRILRIISSFSKPLFPVPPERLRSLFRLFFAELARPINRISRISRPRDGIFGE